MKKIAKRGLALLLMLVMCLPLGVESASAADDTPLAGVDGVVDIWKWTKVKTQADLPDARPTRTVGGSSETYDYALLIIYEYKGTKYFMDFAPENRRTSRGFEMRDRFWLPATKLPEGVDSSLDIFRTKDNIGHVTLHPTGKYDSDNNCKVYNLYAEDNSNSPLYIMFDSITDESGHLGECKGGFCFSDGTLTKYSDISFCTNDAEPSHVSAGKVKMFHNVPNLRDFCLTIDSNDGAADCSSQTGWDMQAFDVYVGVKEQWSAVRSNYTIKSGTVANYNGYIYVEPNVTITVEQGGVLSISGVLYNNGTITCNTGGTVLVQQDASIEQFCLNGKSGGNLYCLGGDLVILAGGRVTANSFNMYSGATLTNFGILVNSSGSSWIEEGSTIDNRASGRIFLGVKPKADYIGNLSSLTRSEVSAPATYEITPAYYRGLTPVPRRIVVGEDVMLYNEGIIYSADHMLRSNSVVDRQTGRHRNARNITCKGSGKIYVYESIKKVNDEWKYTSCMDEWSSMYRTYYGM